MAALTTVLALAEFIPGIVRLFGGDRAGETADQVLDVARNITGQDNAQDAVDAIRKNPELQIQLQQAANPIIIAELEAETSRLESINATMRAEAQSDDPYVRRWRPTLGYVVCFTWGIQMFALSLVMVLHAEMAPSIIGAMGGLSTMWGIAMSILGISVAKRSQDKQVAAGQVPSPGLLHMIGKRILHGKSDTSEE